jgi:DNA topoisomerase-3
VKIASEEFTAKGLMIIERNWLEIYSPWERWSTGQGELPNVQIGSRIRPTSLVMKDGKTTAPQPISGEYMKS